MVVRRKPPIQTVEDYINAGGTSAADLGPQPEAAGPAPVATSQPNSPAEGDEEPRSLKLRIPPSLLHQVDTSVAKRRPAPSRHQWILEAIWEKLEREAD